MFPLKNELLEKHRLCIGVRGHGHGHALRCADLRSGLILVIKQDTTSMPAPHLYWSRPMLAPFPLASYGIFPRNRTMVADSPSIFLPFLQEFFVKASDPLFTCTLKLDVLTALATKDNCATILGELQTYVLHRDKSFVCAAVRAVGRVADARPETADQCLHVRVLSICRDRLIIAAFRKKILCSVGWPPQL